MVLAIWHREALLHFLFPSPHKIAVLGDYSPTTNFLADLVESARMILFRPTGKSVTRPLIDMSKLLSKKPGSICVIAVDGPCGPPGVAKGGAAMLAKLSGAPIIPCSTVKRVRAGQLQHGIG